jgi:hypothetical protein
MKHCFSLTLLLCALSASAADAAKTVRLLTVGNSFSANATHYLKDLAQAGGHTLIHNSLVIGGSSFQVHAEKARKHDAAPKDKAGHYTSGRGLRENLTLEKWDYVTIQQASIKSHDYATYQPEARWLWDYIHKYAPQAKLLIHQTWAYRVDDPRFTKPTGKPGEPKTQTEMYAGLTAAYDRLASELGGARIIPVGDAFHLADTDADRCYKPDRSFQAKTAVNPALPDQRHSLHVGWRWTTKNGKYTLGMDGHHANLAGEYLGACVWYEVLFGESAEGTEYVPKGLAAEDARFLQGVAHRAVLARRL